MLRPSGTDPRSVKRVAMLPIEKGIPLPSGASLARGTIANTLKALEVGDSFVVERKSVAASYDNAKRLGIKIRAVRMPGGAKTRIWRME